MDTAYELDQEEKVKLAEDKDEYLDETDLKEVATAELKQLIRSEEGKMREAARQLAFEEAAALRDYILILKGELDGRQDGGK